MTAREGNGVTDRLIRAVEDQSRATSSIAELHRQNNVQLELIRAATITQTSILEKLTTKFEMMDEDRNKSVQEIKEHIERTSENRDAWWRKVIIVLGVSLVASNLIGVAVVRFIEILKGGK